jgi:hypothetical protein
MKQGVGIDLDNDGKPDLNFDLKTIILVVGGIISLTMSYSTLIKKIEFNSEQIEIAKKLPPTQSLEIIEQKILYLEGHLEKLEDLHDKRIEDLEKKVYKR